MSNEKPGFMVTVSGQYYAGNSKDKSIKTFSNEVFYIPLTVKIQNGRKFIDTVVNGKKSRESVPIIQESNGLRGAQHVIQRRLLAARLSEKYPDFSAVRLCHIVDQKSAMIPAENLIDVKDRPIRTLTLGELKTLCAMESLSTQPGAFANLDDARAAVAAELRGSAKPARRPLPANMPPAEDPDALPQAELDQIESGIQQSSGEVTSADGVPIDEEDPAESLM